MSTSTKTKQQKGKEREMYKEFTPTPLNTGLPWTEKEVEKLEKELLKKLPTKEIARRHKRSTSAIRNKVNSLGLTLDYYNKLGINNSYNNKLLFKF